MRKFLFLSLFCAVCLMPLPNISACVSGEYEFLQSIEEITRYDLIVSATVHDIDDAGIGEILRVDRYFKGSGGEFLASMPVPPALQVATHIRSYDTGCLYDGRAGNSRQIHDFGYLGVWANADGTYGVGVIYSPKDGLVEFYSEDTGFTELTVREFERLLLKYSGQTEATAPLSKPYPLMRFLNITTESGERYRLNPDRSVTWLDPSTRPLAISNDGSHVAFRLDDEMLGFQYLATSKKPLAPWLQDEETGATDEETPRNTAKGLARYGWMHTVPGLYAQFSPNSDFAAVQDKTRLAVYLLSSVIGEDVFVGYGHRMVVREVASFNVTWRDFLERQPLVWSANSVAIAFQDSQGIWLWYFLENAEPQLVVATQEGQELIDISATGRYLRYGRPAEWMLLDVLTTATWKDSLISPDESRLVHFLSDGPEDLDQRNRLRNCSLPLMSCPLVVVQSPHTGVGSEKPPQKVFWHERDLLGLVYRNGIQSIRWSYALEDVFCAFRLCHGVDTPEISAFDYDSRYRRPAFAFEETRIGFGLREKDNYYDSVDLSEYLDSPIVDLEWGQPIF